MEQNFQFQPEELVSIFKVDFAAMFQYLRFKIKTFIKDLIGIFN